MNKVLTVAKNEYLIAVTSKAFLLGVIMMPIFMGGAGLVQYLTKDQVDLSDRKMAVVDQTGKMYSALEEAAKARNESEIFASSDSDSKGAKTQPAYSLEKIEVDEDTDLEALQLELSQRVKKGELFAFSIISSDVFEIGKSGTVAYYSQTPSYQSLANWLRDTVNARVRASRISDLNIAPESVAALSSFTPVKQFGLAEKKDDGKVEKAEEQDRLLTFAVPFAGLMLMFMMIMSVAPAMLNNVLEEKMQKISEFLVSSVSPFQLMLGKLTGAVAVGLTLSAIYLGAAYGLASYFEVSDKVPLSIYAWFVFYLFIALIIFGSIFSAIGAACTEIRDAQSLMTPVMMLVIIPMMCMGPILNSPSSFFAKAVSLFPPATPMLMFARIAMPPGPATWEIVLGTFLTIVFALFCVWAAGKVFRIGILSQGQAPSFGKLIQWVLTK